MAGAPKNEVILKSADIQQGFAQPEWAARFPPVLSVSQAADLLQVPVNTIYDWSSRGLLKGCSRRVGKYLRILRDKLLFKTFNEGLSE
jgi:hypothetical protein